ncbi:MAG TPA: GxxExxY protein [Polyangia bacterium]|jgi:GxxExxY protein|nr:GxxExxY protein [Polyangia bacterium]
MNRQDAADAKEPSVALDTQARAVIGAAIEVHSHLGPGFLESTYEEALCVELELRRVPFQRQVPLRVRYKGRDVTETRLDLIVGEGLVIELKAVSALLPIHAAQVISYLRAGSFQLGLLLNFNVTVMRQGIRRFIWNVQEPWRIPHRETTRRPSAPRSGL